MISWCQLCLLVTFSCLLVSSRKARAFEQDYRPVSAEMGVPIRMRDGINLTATVYTPKYILSPQPAILHLTLYIADEWSELACWYARRGYSFVTVDSRGRGNSQGIFKPFENEGEDGYDIVEWIAQQPWCNGKVAMVGASYTGWDQWSVLKESPAHLATIAPTASTYPGTSGVPKNRNIFLSYSIRWLTMSTGKARGPTFDRDFWVEKYYYLYFNHLPFYTLDKVCGNELTEFQNYIKHPAVDGYWDAMNPSPEQYARMNRPILTTTGYFDADQTGAFLHYERHMQYATQEAREKHYLIIGPWDHGGTINGKNEHAGLLFQNSEFDHHHLLKQWFDWTLKGGPKPEFLQNNVAYYLMGAEHWKYADGLDSIETGRMKLFLDSSENVTAHDVNAPGTLHSRKPTGVDSFDSYIYDPLDTRPGKEEIELGEEPGAYNIMGYSATTQRYLKNFPQWCNRLVYETPPFTEDVELTGKPKVVVWIAMDVPDTDFMVTLHEIRPNGLSIQLTDDALRARYRLSRREEHLIEPGKVTRYEFNQFLFFSRLITKGSRIRMVFWSPNSVFLEKNYNGGGVVAEESAKDAQTAHISLYHDSHHSSYLELPVVEQHKQEAAHNEALGVNFERHKNEVL